MNRCAGICRNGNPCPNYTFYGNNYCGMHRHQVASIFPESVSPDRCCALDGAGQNCRRAPSYQSRYCSYHRHLGLYRQRYVLCAGCYRLDEPCDRMISSGQSLCETHRDQPLEPGPAACPAPVSFSANCGRPRLQGHALCNLHQEQQRLRECGLENRCVARTRDGFCARPPAAGSNSCLLHLQAPERPPVLQIPPPLQLPPRQRSPRLSPRQALRRQLSTSLGGLATDPEGIMRTANNKRIWNVLTALSKLGIVVPEPYRWQPERVSKTALEVLEVCGLPVRTASRFLEVYAQPHPEQAECFADALDLVWQFILHHPEREALQRILREEMLDATGHCYRGYVSRLCNVLGGFLDLEELSTETPSEVLQRNIGVLVLQDVPLSTARPLVQGWVVDLGLPDEEATAWRNSVEDFFVEN